MAYEYEMQLVDLATGQAMYNAGWFRVTQAGVPTKVALTDVNDVAVTTYAKTITSGNVSFRTLETVAAVDIFGMLDTGYTFQLRNVKPGQFSRIAIDRGRLDQTIILPWDIVDDDVTANTETKTGLILPGNCAILPFGAACLVETADAGMTIDFGTDSASGVNDPDGFLDGVSLAATGMVFGAVGFTVGTNNVWIDLTGGDVEFTLGALLLAAATKVAKAEGTDAAAADGNGIFIPAPHIGVGSPSANVQELTFTPSASTDTGAGYLIAASRLAMPV